VNLLDVFKRIKPVVGMLHVPALPGSPGNSLNHKAIREWVLKDAKTLAAAGIDGLILENFGDVPFYPRQVPVHTVAFMTAIACEIRRSFDLPLGINVLRNDAQSALAIAAAADAAFIRVNIHIGARVTDQGLIEGTAHETLRYRKLLGTDVRIFADVDVKHSVPLAQRDLKEEVDELISRGDADAIIVTGRATGKQTALADLQVAKQAAGFVPVFAGSGVDISNLADIYKIADGLFVGTAFKVDGITTNAVDKARVAKFIKTVQTLSVE
jgi:membrane complex biogenesis BtpA family protein